MSPFIAAAAWPLAAGAVWWIADRVVVDGSIGRVVVGLAAQAAVLAVPFLVLERSADAIEARTERDGADAPAPAVLVDIEEGARSWRVRIVDNGIGLPDEARDRLTDPYVTTRVKGTGLGLAIVKKIIEQHAGELHLGDAAGIGGLDGALVTLRLPKPAGRATGATEGEAA